MAQLYRCSMALGIVVPAELPMLRMVVALVMRFSFG